MQKYSQEKCKHSLIATFPGILPRFSMQMEMITDPDCDIWCSVHWCGIYTSTLYIGRVLIFSQGDEVARYSGMLLTLQLFRLQECSSGTSGAFYLTCHNS